MIRPKSRTILRRAIEDGLDCGVSRWRRKGPDVPELSPEQVDALLEMLDTAVWEQVDEVLDVSDGEPCE